MNKFLEWYGKYRTEITWWVIGWLTFAVLDCTMKGDYIFAGVNAALCYINYAMWKNR